MEYQGVGLETQDLSTNLNPDSTKAPTKVYYTRLRKFLGTSVIASGNDPGLPGRQAASLRTR